MQFQFYLVENQYDNAQQEAYFETVTAAVRRAAARAGLQEGRDFEGFLWDLKTFKRAYPTVNLKTTPSVCLKTESDEQVVFYVGKRDIKVLEKAFYDIFMTKKQKTDGDNKDGNGDEKRDGNGTSDGAGGNGWFPFGTRECGFIDEVLDSLGLTKPLKQLVYGGTALYLGSRALQSGNQAGQTVQGVGSAYFLYLALTNSASGCNQKK